MFDYLLTKEQIALRDEVRDFIKWVPRRLVLDMDKDEIKFPKEFLREAGRLNLMGCRYPRQWGGRGMDWVSTGMVMEEIGTIGYTNVFPWSASIAISAWQASGREPARLCP